MKEIFKVTNSKDYPLYLLHNELARMIQQRDLKLTPPKPDELPMNNPQGYTHLCSKIVRRFVGRGEKPNEPGDSWLPRTESQFNFKFT